MKVQLPGGRIVEIERARATPREDVLFGDARALFAAMNIDDFTLAEFHALRAIAMHEKWIEEDEIEITCRNCEKTIVARPCAAMPLGPFTDAELHDEELDARLDLSIAHEVPGLGAVRLGPLTVKDAEPLHRALASRELDVAPAVVRAMGILSIGEKTDPRAISRMIQRCDDRAFGALGNLFLEAHYPLRLFGLVICESCGTRNDVDAPYDREFSVYEDAREETTETFPSFDEFDALAHEIAQPLLEDAPRPMPMLIVDDNVPETDDGGEPLLGSYVPGHEGDARSPVNPGEITIYYKTFAAMWNEDGPYDVPAEIEETIAHELEHHEAHLVGHDPKDDEEREEIARETERVIGKKALARTAASAFALDLREFWKRTWLVWVVALIAAIIAALAAK